MISGAWWIVIIIVVLFIVAWIVFGYGKKQLGQKAYFIGDLTPLQSPGISSGKYLGIVVGSRLDSTITVHGLLSDITSIDFYSAPCGQGGQPILNLKRQATVKSGEANEIVSSTPIDSQFLSLLNSGKLSLVVSTVEHSEGELCGDIQEKGFNV